MTGPVIRLAIAAGVVTVGILVAIITTMSKTPPPAAQNTTQPQLCFGKRCFTVELARTPAERRQGLMYRETLAPHAGMLFIFDQPGRYGFWMKHTRIPLDMLWLDQNWQVVHIERTVPPCTNDPCPRYRPPADARYVLEVNGGAADGIAIGGSAQASEL